MKEYLYDGPVMEFGRCISARWRGSTHAVSEDKARCNLAYQFKKQFGKTPATRITLPGKITLAGRKEN